MAFTPRTHIAAMNRPNKYVATWAYSYYAGGQTTEYAGGFATRKDAVAAVKAAHKDVEILAQREFTDAVYSGYSSARKSQDPYYSRAMEG